MNTSLALCIRPYTEDDWEAVWALLRPVFRAGETYAVDRAIAQDAARRWWTQGTANKTVFVAVDETVEDRHEAIVGTYY